MNVICVCIFLSGPLGQNILLWLDLDKDGDGDVDLIDVLRHWACLMPRFLGGGSQGRLNAMCDFLNKPVLVCLHSRSRYSSCTPLILDSRP